MHYKNGNKYFTSILFLDRFLLSFTPLSTYLLRCRVGNLNFNATFGNLSVVRRGVSTVTIPLKCLKSNISAAPCTNVKSGCTTFPTGEEIAITFNRSFQSSVTKNPSSFFLGGGGSLNFPFRQCCYKLPVSYFKPTCSIVSNVFQLSLESTQVLTVHLHSLLLNRTVSLLDRN